MEFGDRLTHSHVTLHEVHRIDGDVEAFPLPELEHEELAVHPFPRHATDPAEPGDPVVGVNHRVPFFEIQEVMDHFRGGRLAFSLRGRQGRTAKDLMMRENGETQGGPVETFGDVPVNGFDAAGEGRSGVLEEFDQPFLFPFRAAEDPKVFFFTSSRKPSRTPSMPGLAR
jgi:hypothetical protein